MRPYFGWLRGSGIEASGPWKQRYVPQMDSTAFHAMFHEAATRGWDEDELGPRARK
jgi:hypothetical protein